MKRIMGIILFFILAICPIKIYAISEKTEYLDISTNIDFSVGNVFLKNFTITTYANYFNTGNKGYKINANMYNGYEKDVDIKIIVSLYDSNNKVLKEYNDTYTLVSDSFKLYDIGEQYNNLDNIKYYTIDLELLTDFSVPNEDKEENHSYFIEELNNNIEVTKDRNVIYNENIHVAYEKKSNSFYRYLPIRHIYKLEILDIDQKYIQELETGINKISLKSKDEYEKYQDFNFKYKYNNGDDYGRNFDSINVYVVDNYDAAIKTVNFTVNLPSISGLHSIIFYDGNKEVKVDYKKVGNKIIGTLKDIHSNKSIRMNMIFNNGYFTDTKSIIDKELMLSIIFPVTTLVISIVLVLLGIRKNMTKELDTTMLKKYSSLEIGYLYNDKLDDKDILSMIISLANEGYLNINYNNGKYILHKNKEYKGNNEYEKTLFKGIFLDSDEINEEELYKKDPSFIRDIKRKIKKDYNIKFYNSFINKYSIIIILNIISLIIVNHRILSVFDEFYLTIGMIGSIILYLVVFVVINNNNKTIEKIISYLSILVFYIFLLNFIIIPSIKVSKLYMVIYIVEFLCLIVNSFLYRVIPKRKREFGKVLKDINRLRKDIIDKNIDKDLFYEVLPYAYATDLYDIHVNNFDYVKFPMWYDDRDKDYKTMCVRIKELLANITYDLMHEDMKG